VRVSLVLFLELDFEALHQLVANVIPLSFTRWGGVTVQLAVVHVQVHGNIFSSILPGSLAVDTWVSIAPRHAASLLRGCERVDSLVPC
jgi:hypothetical protein